MKKKLSIKDIADQLKVSKTTVSFVLNGKATENGISKAMQRKVLRHIEKVGYRPNKMAQGLRTGKSGTIGMLVEDISDGFFSTVARCLEVILQLRGYRIIYGSTENDTEITKDLIHVFRNHQVDGYIIAPPPGIEAEIRALKEDGLPVVIFDRYVPDVDVDCVVVDNFRGTGKAIQHLIDNGYRHIAMITLASEQIQMTERERGYRQVLAEAGLMPTVKKIRYHEHKEKQVADIADLLKKHPETDALFFATNYLAESGLEAIITMDLNIPDQLGIIAFDDHNLFRLFKPAITAISQPIDAICKEVVELLFARVEDPSRGSKAIELPTALLVRDSTTPGSEKNGAPSLSGHRT